MTIISMLYKGAPGDHSVYQSDFDGSGWSLPIIIPAIVSGKHPSWAPFYDQILFTAWCDGALPYSVKASRYDGPGFWTSLGVVPGALTTVAPAVASMAIPSTKMVVVWKSNQSDSRLRFATHDSLNWSGSQDIADAHSSHTPALARHDDKVHMIWKGVAADDYLYHSIYDGTVWSPPKQVLDVKTSSQPALAVYDNRLTLAWKGVVGDDAIYWSILEEEIDQWTTSARVHTYETGTGPALLPFSGRLHLVWRGKGNDYSLYMANYDGSFWWDQHQIPHVESSSSPTIAEFDPAF